ncbi:MAG TPA: PQQ-binding-like beta-propeller repeat protein [Gemmataceae bacterium]|nr:PQQ-binding-like beta-propeller repeat protein [Gemmataceae bacterium]
MKPRFVSLVIVGLLALALPALAADWPQWRGPDRTGVSTETGLLKEWPEGGPPLVWKAAGLGGGYSTPAVSKGRIYVLGTRGGEEYVFALSEKDGSHVWSARIGPIARAGYPGPRSTPTVDGDCLYALSSDGDLVCLETASGRLLWQKNLLRDFGGRRGGWAYAESPLIDGDVLVCTPGGAQATMIALDKKTGGVIWKSAIPGGDAAAYASVVIGEVANVKQYIQFLARGVVGVEAASGRFLWRYTRSANGTANIPTPIFYDGYVFSASGYNTGGGLVKLIPEGDTFHANEVYFSKDMVNHHGGIVKVGDYLYGTNNNSLLCLEFTNGRTPVWRNRSVGKGSVTCADGHLYVRSEGGAVALVEATPAGYREKGRFHQPDRSREPAWPHPVVANGRLYLRDQDILLCYNIKDPAAR